MDNQPEYRPVPYDFQALSEAEMRARARAFFLEMNQRRSVRFFSDRPVPRECIEYAVRTAGTAPSGANMQPWTFVAVDDSALKRRIREGAEKEERTSYEGGRMSPEWREALAPLGTDWRKPFLETAPYLVVCFAQRHGLREDGRPRKHYYVQESVGMACGLFITAIHRMGLVTLTHTPSPMRFLNRILNRPEHESPYVLFPVGFPADDVTVPDIKRKDLDEFLVWNA